MWRAKGLFKRRKFKFLEGLKANRLTPFCKNFLKNDSRKILQKSVNTKKLDHVEAVRSDTASNKKRNTEFDNQMKFKGNIIMKKIALTLIATTMTLSAAFASADQTPAVAAKPAAAAPAATAAAPAVPATSAAPVAPAAQATATPAPAAAAKAASAASVPAAAKAAASADVKAATAPTAPKMEKKMEKHEGKMVKKSMHASASAAAAAASAASAASAK